jgi:hypothetical protein
MPIPHGGRYLFGRYAGLQNSFHLNNERVAHRVGGWNANGPRSKPRSRYTTLSYRFCNDLLTPKALKRM